MSAAVVDGVWQVRGDDAPNKNDVIVVEALADDPSTFRAVINGQVAGTATAGAVTRVEIDGGAGDDRITVALGAAGANIAVRVTGGDGNDRITGSANNEEFFGGAGDDVIEAGGGNDVADGEAGNDRVVGGDGDDTVRGGVGADVAAGGWGTDLVEGGKGPDRLKGGGDNDDVRGDAGNDRVAGGEGADSLDGGKGADRVYREAGVDYIGSATGKKADKKDKVDADDSKSAIPRGYQPTDLKKWVIETAVKQFAWAFGKSNYPWTYYSDTGGAVVARFAGGGTSVPVGGVTDGGGPTLTPTPTPTPAPLPPTSAPNVGGGTGAETPTPSPSPTPTTTPEDSSGTNTQEQGVDEADLVETDGRYIFSLHGDELVITEAVPAGGMRVVSRTDVEDGPLGIYLHGKRVTVISGAPRYYILPMPVIGRPLVGAAEVGGDVAISPIVPPPPQEQKVTVTVFDVADPASPKVVERTKLDGTYDSSRMVGDRLYVAVRNDTWIPSPKLLPGGGTDPGGGEPPPVPIATPVPAPEPGGTGGGGVVPDVGAARLIAPPGTSQPPAASHYESEADYRARLEAMPLEELLPGYTSTAGGSDSSGLLVEAPGAYVRDLEDSQIGQNLTTLALLNVGDNAGGPTDTTTVAGFGGTTYASADAFYIASNDWSPTTQESVTQLMKFGMGADEVPLLATGQVKGSVLNQFSMDEEGDAFRIATNHWKAGDSESTVSVLEQVGDDLNVIGSVGGLGKGETIRSVRFVGSRGYVVTFRQIDPLFTIDLSNPRSPKLAGELKVPGFSTYLHPVSDTLLLGIGRDVDEDSGQDRGLQVSLFDVSNIASPKRVARYDVSGLFSGSEAEYDHHAFSYFSDQQILAFPVNEVEVDGGRESLVVLKVDAAGGKFDSLGAAEPPSGVRRSLRIGEVLYAIGSEHIQAVDLDNPATVLGTVKTVE